MNIPGANLDSQAASSYPGLNMVRAFISIGMAILGQLPSVHRNIPEHFQFISTDVFSQVALLLGFST